ncbi:MULTISPECIES: hypothetical protein [Mycolicibacterium]|jgi:ABC-type transport system involved in Fe-S cluster assembly fused permease/ATPase subunit|uniref:Transmembrane protein n=1 Tax=Mycolicibacterium fortuitum TaxID=1766 RepID=A0AAE4VGG9_MYCFO|nr:MULTISPECIES: hypothetical protein [Mycolicibacterium]MDV7194260.1 hypothetical protein [Mycolicibacterium fortuitum]MDV7294321.1 hypothetical protein [Mycolicibacterium fortuitum]MDV7301434.1 hypothetical protein [Mycolicibacterium fortuitum]MDV7323236.1 hypothetical protein [Mycolicibacterium fortuitum]MDV7363514.1 hypothetical protein [Mycolicibacterium fortuitum]
MTEVEWANLSIPLVVLALYLCIWTHEAIWRCRERRKNHTEERD